MKKYISIGVIAVLVGLLVGFVVGYVYNGDKVRVGAAADSGTYNNVTGFSEINLTPTTANGTSTGILNTGYDRAVISTAVMCTGVGSSRVYGTGAGLLSAGWTLTAATSTVTTGFLGNVNYILNTTLATTTGNVYNASSTEGVLTTISRIWPAGTYLTFNFNATNTAACSLGVEWLPL